MKMPYSIVLSMMSLFHFLFILYSCQLMNLCVLLLLMKTLEKLASNKNELLFIEEFYMLSEYQKVVYIFQEKVLPWSNQTVEQFCRSTGLNHTCKVAYSFFEILHCQTCYSILLVEETEAQ